MENKQCPYCQSHNTNYDNNEQRWLCLDCDCLFDDEDIQREKLRHMMSILLNDTDEDCPIECDICLSAINSVRPHIDKCYMLPGEGSIWLHIDRTPEDEWMDFDEFDLEDLRDIVTGLIQL